MATLRVGVSAARFLSSSSSTHLTADSGIQAVSLFSRPALLSTSTRKSGSSKSRSRATPSRVSSSKNRTVTFAISLPRYNPSWAPGPANRALPDLPRAFGTHRDVPPHGLGLIPPQLARDVGREQRDRLLVVELACRLERDELLLEAKARPVEQRLDRAFGHLQDGSDP